MHPQYNRWISKLSFVPVLVLLSAPVFAAPPAASFEVAQVGPPPVESQGKPIDPTHILGQPGGPYQAHSREASHAICNDRWNECVAKCERKLIGQNSCLKKCDKQQEKCLDTYP